jgi:hypothetical protein
MCSGLFLLLIFLGMSTAVGMNASVEQHHPHFVGLWRVDQPTHALYEATLYDFQPDGELIVVKTFTLGGYEDDYVTGTVARLDVVCRFGSRWHSLSDQHLIIQGDCLDGVRREIELSLSPVLGTETFDAEIVSVAGESGWTHQDWAWSWARCSSREICLP